jgi:predicted amidohydrolase YtcJ
MTRANTFLALFLIFTSLATFGCKPRQHASILFVNGRIYTVCDDRPQVEALAVVGDRIGGLGTTKELTTQFVADTVIDLQGRPAYPGFIDAHAHVEGMGAALMTLNLRGKSLEEIQGSVREDAKRKDPGHWVRGRGWDQNLWKRKTFPTHRDLDSLAPDRPVYLVRIDGHAVWVNRKVLAMANIGRNTPDPPGGRIVREANGEPTGVFVDNAADLLARLIPGPSHEERTEAVRRAIQECLAKGITEIHDMGSDLGRIEIYKSLASKNDLPLRVYVALDGTEQGLVESYLLNGPEIGLFGGRITVRAIKLYADGALGSRGAALIEPYSDDPGNRGLTITSAGELERAATVAVEKGFQLCVHAIGDRANSVVLSAFDKTFKTLNVKGIEKRFRIEHAQVLAPQDIPRFASIGVIPSMQPVHCTSDMSWVTDRLGRERAKGAYAWHSLISTGSIIPGGSDAPVEDPDIVKNFYAAVTRQRLDGTPRGGWDSLEQMSRQEALRSFTIWGSRAAFEDSTKGTLQPGKWADLVVLSDDLMTVESRKIPDIAVDITVVGGKIVYVRREAGR